MSYLNDICLGDTFDFKFTTRQISGAPFTLAGSPVISAYPGNSTTEITAGITLTVDFDGKTGLNNVRVVATSGNGYATATNYAMVITTGTVNSVSVVGEVQAHFSIENRVLNNAKLHADTGLKPVVSGTAQGGGASTVTLPSTASATDDAYNDDYMAMIVAGPGVGGFGIISDYVGASKVATINGTWQLGNPDATSSVVVFPGGGDVADVAAAVWAYATRILTAATNITNTGGTTVAQTGDAFLRLGTPAGASTAADIAAVNAKTTNLPSDPADASDIATATTAIFNRLGAPAGASVSADIAAIQAKTTNLPSDPADQSAVEAAITASLTTAVADSIPADGSRPSISQALYLLTQFMLERSVSGTTVTIKKPDGSTTLFTLTLNDGTSPTSITRTT